jgi:hypothetical protein
VRAAVFCIDEKAAIQVLDRNDRMGYVEKAGAIKISFLSRRGGQIYTAPVVTGAPLPQTSDCFSIPEYPITTA